MAVQGKHRSKLELRVHYRPNSAKTGFVPRLITKQRLGTRLAELDQGLNLAGLT